MLQGIADYKREIPVAVKTLSFKNQHLLDKFMEEINLMKKFAHPNIVGLLGMYRIFYQYCRSPAPARIHVHTMHSHNLNHVHGCHAMHAFIW